MIKETSYSLIDIFAIGAWIYVRNLHLNLEDEMANRPACTNNLFEGGIEPPSVLLGTFELH